MSIEKDHCYAEMLQMMRSMGSKDNPITLQIGVMLNPTSVKVDDLILNAEDIYIADYLVSGYTQQIEKPYVSAVSGGSTSVSVETQESLTYKEGLKKGDLVAVQRLHNTNKFVILARVVTV